MNKDWIKLWNDDLQRRAVEAQAPLERHKAMLDVYAAQVGLYKIRAANIAASHPLVHALVKDAAGLPVLPNGVGD